MKNRVEELQQSGKKDDSGLALSLYGYVKLQQPSFLCKTGVSSFILVGLEGVPKFEEALQLEFGRGFRYTRPLRLNVMDLDYELMEELVSSHK